MRRVLSALLCLTLLCATAPAYALTYEELLQKATEYAAAGEYDKSYACCDLAIKTDSSKTEAYTVAGFLYLENGNTEQALVNAQAALAINSTLPDGWLLKCRIDMVIGDVAAFDSDELYAEICGTDLTPYASAIGEMYANAGAYESATKYFSVADPDTLTEAEQKAYCQALIATGNRTKAEALGLIAEIQRNEKLDAAFEADNLTLVEYDTGYDKPTDTDFEISQDLLDYTHQAGLDGNLTETLKDYIATSKTELLSLSPTGNSGLLAIGPSGVSFYNGKYHILYPSTKGVEDTYGNLQMYSEYCMNRFSDLISSDGAIYSKDGRYAIIPNSTLTFMRMQLIVDPILIDLATGEIILTATSPQKAMEDYSALITALFSQDGHSLYYLLYGHFGDCRTRLCRYDLNTRVTENCLDIEENIYLTPLMEKPDGSLFFLSSTSITNEPTKILTLTKENGQWTAEKTDYTLPYYYSNPIALGYSTNTGYVVTLDANLIRQSYSFQILNADNKYSGIDRYYCIHDDTNETISFTDEEFQTMLDGYITEKSDMLGIEFPYQAIKFAKLSPDGNYMLLYTNCMSEKGIYNGFYMVRLSDFTLREIKGLSADAISPGNSVFALRQTVIWNTEDLIIRTKDGIKTYRFQ